MKTLITLILSITPLVALAETTHVNGVQLSAMGLFLTLLVLYTFTWLFRTAPNTEKAVNASHTATEQVITETLQLPVGAKGNLSTSVKLLQSNDNEDTFIIVAKVNKKANKK